ncbi:dihydrolipoyl dehydrogenase [Lysinibacillus alkalisoli]|uniref:Dihydrolipoyl dehydrogenase n=1 Tax=Lysinibacillus alkalisoli TaxID=1911548 RepID=A0A917LF52_9BACI|nr:dihydrolipoyl dehydrogenase [Lysinibacillus alkalisoli]GGG18256.1 dihydrolipoyl dehydrogenase [Lysinibacillus alkalisoli]
MTNEYDLVIIGGGAGGYVAAIRAAQSGLKTAIVEHVAMGGTCLHRGCIPSKAMLRSAEVYRTLKQDAAGYGVEATGVFLHFNRVQERKRAIVQQLYSGVQGLMQKGHIDVYEGFGRILGPSIFSPMPGTVSVEMVDGSENAILIPKNVIIATGTTPRVLPGIPVDGEYVMTSDHALNIQELPKSILIIGGGVIGVEWASMFIDFGVEVTVLEQGDRLLPQEDTEISKTLSAELRKRGVNLITDAVVKTDSFTREGEHMTLLAEVNGEVQSFEGERIFLSIGRTGNVNDIGLQNTEIEVEHGFIKVNENYQTKESHIYAIGDVIGGVQLAHVASNEGMAAVEHIIKGETTYINGLDVPRCIYSYPEAASIGYSESQAKEAGFDIKVGKFPFQANGKALVYGESVGFVKVIADKNTNDLLGVHMVGPHVTDMISEAALAKVLDATPWEISLAIHPHPTLSEVFAEASMAIDGLAIHK